ncbi:MAG TPA: hypothetical protein VN178_06385 [Rubrobacter sp.]|jgi:hypothetical protein|nr:hypothetical protein [Rubrobacter sp.]
MRRAVILATLTCILFAVAGVTVAGENRFTSGSQDGDQTESTVAGRTVPEATAREATVPEATVPETTVSEDVEKPVEEAEETTVVVRKEPKGPGKGDPGAGSYGGIREDDSFEKAGGPTGKPGKPEHVRGGKKYGKSRVAGEPPGKSKPAKDGPDHAGKKGIGGNPGKVTLCHKNRVTISVGAPAEPAHLRHGDELGAC